MRELKRLNPSKATEPDGISARVLQQCASTLSRPLSRLFSLCLASSRQRGRLPTSCQSISDIYVPRHETTCPCPSLYAIHTTGRFSNVTDTFTIIVANREWVSSHANASRLCSSVGWHRSESFCTISKEKTRCALKKYYDSFIISVQQERTSPIIVNVKRGPIVSAGVDPQARFGRDWSCLTFMIRLP